jgi:hypothetical protein
MTKSYAGKSYVIFGKTDTGAIDLSKLGGGSKYTIDYLGDKNANTLTGTHSDEIFVLLPNTLRILVLVEASNNSSKLSFRILLPEPVMSITSMFWILLITLAIKTPTHSQVPIAMKSSLPAQATTH